MDDEETIIKNGVIEIDEDRITHVGEESTNYHSYFNEIIDVQGNLVTPGLHNAHTHSPLSIAKGATDKAFHAIGMWHIQAWTANRTPEEIYISALHGCIEMLKTGAIGCIDHFPEQGFEKRDVDAVAKAYLKTKMKANIALRVYDKEYGDILPVQRDSMSSDLQDRIRNSSLKIRPISETLDICKYSIEKWHDYDGKLQIMLGPSAPLRCSEKFLKQIKQLSDQYNLGTHTHLLESKVQTEISQKVYGKTLVEMLDDIGLLNERMSCAHTIWATKNDIEILGSKGVSVVHNIGSNGKGSAGIAPIYELMKAGCNIALGTDGSSSNGSQNLFSITKLALVVHRINQPNMDKWISTKDIYRMLTKGGAKSALMESSSGSIEIGKKADLVIFDVRSPWLNPLNDPYNQLVYGENGSSVDTVIIDGEIVVEKGKILTFDEEEVHKGVIELAYEMKKRNRDIFKIAQELTPLLREEHLRRFRN